MYIDNDQFEFNGCFCASAKSSTFLLENAELQGGYYFKSFFSRSKDIVEPLIKPQWYVNCQEMAADAVKVS